MSLFIHHLAGGGWLPRGGEGKGKERRGEERKTIGTWPISASPIPVEMGGIEAR